MIVCISPQRSRFGRRLLFPPLCSPDSTTLSPSQFPSPSFLSYCSITHQRTSRVAQAGRSACATFRSYLSHHQTFPLFCLVAAAAAAAASAAVVVLPFVVVAAVAFHPAVADAATAATAVAVAMAAVAAATAVVVLVPVPRAPPAQNPFVPPFPPAPQLLGDVTRYSGCCCDSGKLRLVLLPLDRRITFLLVLVVRRRRCRCLQLLLLSLPLLPLYHLLCSFCLASSSICCYIRSQIACKTPASPFCCAFIPSRLLKSNWP